MHEMHVEVKEITLYIDSHEVKVRHVRDAQGAVVEERLLQGLGHGVDERVIAVLRDWRFRPATENGTPVSARVSVTITLHPDE